VSELLKSRVSTFALLILISSGTTIGWAQEVKAELVVTPVSPRAGFLFTDTEPLDVRVKVDRAKMAARVDYVIQQADGAWRSNGTVKLSEFSRGSEEKVLPLKLPGRGLYKLNLMASAGSDRAEAETWVAIVFTPPPPDPRSPWGLFYVPPSSFYKLSGDGALDVAQSYRLLGASWARLNFWSDSFGKITLGKDSQGNKRIKADYSLWKSYARALRQQGISILGEVAQIPRELSSRPNDNTVNAGDAGPFYSRVKPRDYQWWEQLMENLSRDFREEIQVWEIWNEADSKNSYWTGTVEDFAELVRRTSQALRRGNPETRIAASGFTTSGTEFADKLFQLGFAKNIDILSVHYTDGVGGAQGWSKFLQKYDLKLPIWNTEESSVIPLNNLSSRVEHSFKFLHVAIGYPELQPLVRQDMTVLPAGITFSVGAHCIGTGRYVETSDKIPGVKTYLFQRGSELIGVFRKSSIPALLDTAQNIKVTLAIEPLFAGSPPTVTDVWGQSRPLAIKDGKATLDLDNALLFLNGARKLEIIGSNIPQAVNLQTNVHIFEAETGRWSPGWSVIGKKDFSGNKVLEIWAEDGPKTEGYWVDIKVKVPTSGRYEFLFSGNALSRLKSPRSVSPFTWSIDGGKEHGVYQEVTIVKGTQTIGEGLSALGVMNLKQGEHLFRLKVTGRREQFDKRYALWFDALVLRYSPTKKNSQAQQ
jgi:hypothetical protein